MVEYLALSFRTTVPLVERNLVADTEFHKFRNMHMGLAAGLEIEIVEEAVSQTETDIMTGFFTACSVRRIIQKRALGSYHACLCHILVITIVDMSGRVVEIYAPVNQSCNLAELEFIVDRNTCTKPLCSSIVNILFIPACQAVIEEVQFIVVICIFLECSVTIKAASGILGHCIIIEHLQSESDSVPVVHMVYGSRMK